MSTKYFILSKPKDANKSVADNTDNQIVHLNETRLCYILPQNIMTYYCDRGLFEAQLIEWCKQFCSQEKTFLDIGAHTGTYTLSLSGLCKQVFSFEPQQMTYYALCGSIALSNLTNVKCLNLGLGSEDQVGRNVLNIVSNDGGGSSLHLQEGQPVLREEVIHIDTLDNVALTHGILDNIGFIKMDVEDNEYYVLLGAKETLEASNYPTILFECNDKVKNQNLFDYLVSLGYNVVQVSGVMNMYLASL
jgi:FkbM family methyltransferase